MTPLSSPWKGQTQSILIEVTNFHINTFSAAKAANAAGSLFKRFAILYPGKVLPSLNNPHFKDTHISYPRHPGTQMIPFVFAETF